MVRMLLVRVLSMPVGWQMIAVGPALRSLMCRVSSHSLHNAVYPRQEKGFLKVWFAGNPSRVMRVFLLEGRGSCVITECLLLPSV